MREKLYLLRSDKFKRSQRVVTSSGFYMSGRAGLASVMLEAGVDE